MESLAVIQQKLRRVMPELQTKYHVCSLGLFGSVVRNDFNEKSDIDIIVDFNGPIGIEFIDLAEELEKTLNNKVDLVSKAGIKPAYYHHIAPQIVYV